MSRRARLRMGRAVSLGFSVWFRRFIPIHIVAAVCLAPLVLVPDTVDPWENGLLMGVFGLHASAWVVAVDLHEPVATGLTRNVLIGYLAQFAVLVILVRDAHRRIARRDGRKWLRAVPGILAYAFASLGAFIAVDFPFLWGAFTLSPILAFVAVAGSSIVSALLAGRYWLALPAAAVDGNRFFASLGRSRWLARGAGHGVAQIAVLLVVLQWLVAMIFGILAPGYPWVLAAPAVLLLTLKGCVLAAAYRELSLMKEGPDPEELGSVFA